jgi:hypothetical protein
MKLRAIYYVEVTLGDDEPVEETLADILRIQASSMERNPGMPRIGAAGPLTWIISTKDAPVAVQ